MTPLLRTPTLAFLLLSPPACAAPAPEPRQDPTPAPVVVGADRLFGEYADLIRGKRLALVSNHSGGLELVVLDRPNPITGRGMDGFVTDSAALVRFGSYAPVPVVHGLTLGELAQLYNGEGLLRGKPSPNLDAAEAARLLNGLGLSGVTFEAEPYRAGVALLWAVHRLHPDRLIWNDLVLDRLVATPRLKEMLLAGAEARGDLRVVAGGGGGVQGEERAVSAVRVRRGPRVGARPLWSSGIPDPTPAPGSGGCAVRGWNPRPGSGVGSGASNGLRSRGNRT